MFPQCGAPVKDKVLTKCWRDWMGLLAREDIEFHIININNYRFIEHQYVSVTVLSTSHVL